MKMNRVRFWNGTLVVAGVMVWALALSIANRGIVSGEAAGPPDSKEATQVPAAQQGEDVQGQTYEGMITDTRCGAKHSASIGMAASDCVRVCVHAGERFALVDGEALYVLDGETAALKRVAGQRVRITGKLSGNKIAVASVAPTY